jgi:hypothetical protein
VPQRAAVASVIIDGAAHVDWTNDSVLQGLARSGILLEPYGFSCLAARADFYKTLYSRPKSAPTSIEDLITESVKSLSAL